MSNVMAFGLWRVDWILVSDIHAKFKHWRESSSIFGDRLPQVLRGGIQEEKTPFLLGIAQITPFLTPTSNWGNIFTFEKSVNIYLGTPPRPLHANFGNFFTLKKKCQNPQFEQCPKERVFFSGVPSFLWKYNSILCVQTKRKRKKTFFLRMFPKTVTRGHWHPPPPPQHI